MSLGRSTLPAVACVVSVVRGGLLNAELCSGGAWASAGKEGTAPEAPPESDAAPPPEEEEPEEDVDEDPSPVFALGQISLASLARGCLRQKLHVPLSPATTLRGGGDLEWKTRPGRYREADSVLTLSVRAAAPLQPRGVPRPYERAVFVMHFKDTALFKRLEALVHDVNASSLGLQGSAMHVLQTLVTYRFDETQRADSTLDVLTGVHLIDRGMRMILLEGLRDGAMTRVHDMLSDTLRGSTSLLPRKVRATHGSLGGVREESRVPATLGGVVPSPPLSPRSRGLTHRVLGCTPSVL